MPELGSPPSTRIRLLRIAAGFLVTIIGVTALTVAFGWGTTAADVALELGVGIGLSGALWWCGVRLRGERPSSATDYSALLIVGGAGCALVLWAVVTGGKQSREVLTSAGAAVVTLWLFIGLEQQFELESRDTPLWEKLITLPIAPFLWLWFRDFELPVFRSDLAVFNPKQHLDDLELPRRKPRCWTHRSAFALVKHGSNIQLLPYSLVSAQLGAIDSDSHYRDPAYYNEVFSPTVDDVERHLGISLPQPVVAWIKEKGDHTIALADGGTLVVWTLAMIRMHPVDLPDAVVCFATETEAELQAEADKPEMSRAVFVVAVDLRAGPLHGTVVRGRVLPGNPPQWPVYEPLQVVASGFEQWRTHQLVAA